MSMDRRDPRIGPVLAVLFAFLSGCASSPTPAATPATGPGGIPIPAGFQKVEKDSVLITIGESQAGLVVYRGAHDPPSVVEFYRETLSSQGWQLVASFIGEDSILVFTKAYQACIISVSGDHSSSRLEVRIGIVESPQLGPSRSSRISSP